MRPAQYLVTQLGLALFLRVVSPAASEHEPAFLERECQGCVGVFSQVGRMLWRDWTRTNAREESRSASDDDATGGNSFGLAWSDLGYETFEAADGQEALTAFGAGNAEVMLLDQHAGHERPEVVEHLLVGEQPRVVFPFTPAAA